MTKKLIKLINNERTNTTIGSQKASSNECDGDTTSIDICYYLDRAHCYLYAYDYCGKDYSACTEGGYDYCSSSDFDNNNCNTPAGYDRT